MKFGIKSWLQKWAAEEVFEANKELGKGVQKLLIEKDGLISLIMEQRSELLNVTALLNASIVAAGGSITLSDDQLEVGYELPPFEHGPADEEGNGVLLTLGNPLGCGEDDCQNCEVL